MTTPLLTSSSSTEEPVDAEWEKENKTWYTHNEKAVLKKCIDKGYKEGAKQSLLGRRIWRDGQGTSINKYFLFQYYEEITGERLI